MDKLAQSNSWESIYLEIPGKPISQVRSRSTCHGHHYNPQRKVKASIQMRMLSMRRQPITKDPVTVYMYFCFPIPKSWSKAKQHQAIAGHVLHDKKPDIDNLQKFYLDCLSKVFVEDDRQVQKIISKKGYSTNPKTVIKIFRGEYVPERVFNQRDDYDDGDAVRFTEAIPGRSTNQYAVQAEPIPDVATLPKYPVHYLLRDSEIYRDA